ncbi:MULTISPECIES: HVO_2922 family protein [Saliphagus]|uniref:HVO_2922 family protein n=1 Tax=Saliphagus infecundisoli TaxID=1849069 RepID=A0ABD5QDI9_9EURY|nr:HVO_2922 family protein [Saliphagus infecundisoli]
MSRKARFELYRDTADEWRWRLVVSNGNIIADSGEGYASKQGAQRGIRSVKASAPDAEIVVSE